MKKLCFADGEGRREYLEKLGTREAAIIMKTRLHMLQLKANFRGRHADNICVLYQEEEDTTEHLFECKGLKKENKENWRLEDLQNPNRKLVNFITLVMERKEIKKDSLEA